MYRVHREMKSSPFRRTRDRASQVHFGENGKREERGSTQRSREQSSLSSVPRVLVMSNTSQTDIIADMTLPHMGGPWCMISEGGSVMY